jgi:hypothetical protein
MYCRLETCTVTGTAGNTAVFPGYCGWSSRYSHDCGKEACMNTAVALLLWGLELFVYDGWISTTAVHLGYTLCWNPHFVRVLTSVGNRWGGHRSIRVARTTMTDGCHTHYVYDIHQGNTSEFSARTNSTVPTPASVRCRDVTASYSR